MTHCSTMRWRGRLKRSRASLCFRAPGVPMQRTACLRRRLIRQPRPPAGRRRPGPRVLQALAAAVNGWTEGLWMPTPWAVAPAPPRLRSQRVLPGPIPPELIRVDPDPPRPGTGTGDGKLDTARGVAFFGDG